MNEPKGCLSAILGFFGITLAGPRHAGVELPYRQRDDFLSAAELAFYRVLANIAGNRAIICPKVNLADIVFVVGSKENQSYRNKIDRKHVDFLLCDPGTMQPRCGIELDDSSHARPDRQRRDEFVDRVFQAAGLPLLRVPAQRTYNLTTLTALLDVQLSGVLVEKSLSPAARAGEIPTCPKCDVPMIERVAKAGSNAGKTFFGCPNYPRCREVVQIHR